MSSALYYSVDAVDNVSILSVSTNATEANIPGVGRTIGLFYDYAGGKLQKKINQVSEKLGYGPRATALKIEKTLNDPDLGRPQLFFAPSKGNRLTKYCYQLLKYIGCASLYFIYHIFSDIHCSDQMYQQLKCKQRTKYSNCP